MSEYDDDLSPLGLRPLFPAPAAPLDVARKLYAKHRTGAGRTLVCWRGGWWQWAGADWSEMDAAEMRSGIYDSLGAVAYEHPVTKCGVTEWERRPWNPDKRKVANVIEAMAAVAHLSAEVDPPSWIAAHNSARTDAAQMISCRNGVLDLSTRKVIDHTPALFNVVSVPFDYEPDAPTPEAWLKFLASIWPGDQQSIDLLQEFFGYVLSGRTDMQKMLLMVGPPRSGKGTAARILTALVGRANTAGPTMASLGTNFGLAPLLGKPLAIIPDARLGDAPAHTVVERLLSITGEDLLTVDRKFREPWSGKLPTRFVMLSNELPKFRDSSGAIANRLLILQMTDSFLGREDHALGERVSAELPGILRWALEGLDRLTAKGKFTVPESSHDAAALMMDLASPVSAFVRERCYRRPDVSVSVDDLYDAWKVWAENSGHAPGAKSTFGRNLRSAVPSVRLAQPRADGTRVRQYVGIALGSGTDSAKNPVPPVPPGSADSGTGTPRADDDAKPQVSDGGTGGTGKTALHVLHNAGTGISRATVPPGGITADTPGAETSATGRCACGVPLETPESIARGMCAECRNEAGEAV